MTALKGKSIGRYHILEQLGAGGMAVVYKAYDMRLDRNVAIKVVLPHFQQTDEFLKRFEREAQTLARLTHPNVVGVIDYGDHEGMLYIVMEYIPSGSLKELTGRPMPYREATRLVLPVARALAAAHQQGIVHRDVKPANILITGTGEPMLSDFGIARILDSGQGGNLTGTGLTIGTPEYMSPEQATAGVVDQRADIYALGIVLYELLAGRTPFKADTPIAVLLKQASEPLPRPREFIPELPEEIERVLLKALAKSPEERYQRMEDFAAALESALAAVPSGPVDRAQMAQGSRTGAYDGQPQFEPAPIQQAGPLVQVPAVEKEPSSSRDWIMRAGVPLGILGVVSLFFLLAAALFVFFIWRPFGTAEAVSQGTASPTNALPISTEAVPVALESPAAETAIVVSTPEPSETTQASPAPTFTEAPPLEPQNPLDSAFLDRVPAGMFLMGSEPDLDPYFWGAEFPQRTVTIDYEYYIYRTEVTNGMYRLCVQAGACPEPQQNGSMTRNSYYDNPDFDTFPVIYVAWDAAQSYCQWAGGRLPSEAEWEKAARGEDGRLFPWGNEPADGTRVNYCDRNCTGSERNDDNDGFADTAPVGSFPANASPYGALDMSGNVLEWVSDWFQPFYYESAPDLNPTGPDSGNNGQRVARGGSFFQDVASMRAIGRTPRNPDLPQETIGFRCVMDDLP